MVGKLAEKMAQIGEIIGDYKSGIKKSLPSHVCVRFVYEITYLRNLSSIMSNESIAKYILSELDRTQY